jgi:hypothetical protein
VPRSTALASVSCAMAATACCVVERAAHYAIGTAYPVASGSISSLSGSEWNRSSLTLVSHGVGGVVGGAFLGAMYARKPIQGMLVFGPLMVASGVGDVLYNEMRDERIEEIRLAELQANQDEIVEKSN